MTIDNENQNNAVAKLLEIKNNNLINFIKKNSPSKFVIVMSATSLFYLFLMAFLFNNSLNIFNRWGANLKYYTKIDTINFISLKEYPLKVKEISYNIDDYTKSKEITDIQKTRIKEQIYVIRDRAITNLRIARDLYYWMTISTIILCVSTIISGMCAYSIIKKGWDDVDDAIKGIFLASLGASLFSTFFYSFYQFQKNAETNMTLYQTYVNLEDYIFSSLTVGYLSESPENMPTKEKAHLKSSFPEDLIHKIDKIMEAYSLRIEFDSQSIPKLNDVIKSVDGKNNNQ
jgi:hypothetical protein